MTDLFAARAPDIDAFAEEARAAFEALPAAFREKCGDIVVRIEEFPDEEVMDDLELESPFDLLGLFQGLSLVERGAEGGTPNYVFLYRRPILDIWAEGEETLRRIVVHVLVHEIGHHFGFSDADMDAIEARGG